MNQQSLSHNTSADAWGTFDLTRKHLQSQFDEVEYNPCTGLSVEELKTEVESYLESHVSVPHVIQKANIYKLVVTKGRIAVDPLDWFADKLNHGDILRRVCDRWQKHVEKSNLPFETQWLKEAFNLGSLHAVLDLGHISPGWEFMLRNGLSGLIEKAKKYRESYGNNLTLEQADFYKAVEIVYTSTVELSHKFSRLAKQMVSQYPEHEARLMAMSNSLSKVPENPPETFHEALQFLYLMHQLIEMEGENVRSMGGFDRLLYPYYKADIESGRLTRDHAKELIKFFWTKFFATTKGIDNGKNFYFAGQYPDGSSAVNELSYLALEAYEELKTTDPKLSVRICSNTPPEFLRRVADVIRNGQTSFVLVNDEVAVPAIIKRGKTIEEARSYLLIGCYEPAIEGREVACNMSIKINLAKGIELALNNGLDPLTGTRLGPETGDPLDFKNFKEFQNAYYAQLNYQVSHAIDYIKAFELYWPVINPSPLIAGTFIDCLEKGMDICQGGPKYNNTGSMGACLANAADSLLSIKKLIFDDKKYTFDELLSMLKADFEGFEYDRQYILNCIPKWGNNDDEADVIAKQITDRYTSIVNNSRNNRGGSFQASMFTLTYRWDFGKHTGALPDGRKACTPLAPGINSMTGRDKKGVTALINSASKLDFQEIPNGSVLDINLHPTAVRGIDGLSAFEGLIKSFFAQGGYGLQFNIFSTETLRDAQKHPEQYSTLQIRLTGWNVYFVSLSEFEQNQFIEENKHQF